MCLKRVSPHQERPAVRQLDIDDLKLDALATDFDPVFAPVELESLAWLEYQRHLGAASCRLFSTMSIFHAMPWQKLPRARKTLVSKLQKIRVHLLKSAPNLFETFVIV